MTRSFPPRSPAIAIAFAFSLACEGDPNTPVQVPLEIREAPNPVTIAGTQLTLSGFAFREYSASDARIGSTHWVARLTPPPGTPVPSFDVTELWYIVGTAGGSTLITQAQIIRINVGTEVYFEVRADGGDFRAGDEVDIAVKILDATGSILYARVPNVPVQRTTALMR
jgi:hypothetical protein